MKLRGFEELAFSTISGAPAFAFAIAFGVATVVGGFAAALAFAAVFGRSAVVS